MMTFSPIGKDNTVAIKAEEDEIMTQFKNHLNKKTKANGSESRIYNEACIIVGKICLCRTLKHVVFLLVVTPTYFIYLTAML